MKAIRLKWLNQMENHCLTPFDVVKAFRMRTEEIEEALEMLDTKR
jgi:hypothetical protein